MLPACDAPGERKREVVVHHRVPGKSVLALILRYALVVMPSEPDQGGCDCVVAFAAGAVAGQHTTGHEQTTLDSKSEEAACKARFLLR